MGQISLSLPQVGQTNLSQEPLIPSDFTTVQNVINGNLDGTNVTAAFAQAAAVNQSGQTVKGAVSNTGPGTRTNVAYGALNDAADQVTGIVLPSNGLIAVWCQMTWQSSVNNAGSAAIFIGANQVVTSSAATPGVQVANSNGTASNSVLHSASYGLVSPGVTAGYTGDLTTGQIIGDTSLAIGGPCYIFAAAGTYTVSVQFKASSGSVTASNRKLWVQALSFA